MYQAFKDEEGEAYGSFECFYFDGSTELIERFDGMAPTPMEPGWYWWACFPGCLPDSDPSGPFSSRQEAIANANA